MVKISFDDEEQRNVPLRRDGEHCEERGDEIYVRCPFCEAWSQPRDLLVDGCECGASAATFLQFTTDGAHE